MDCVWSYSLMEGSLETPEGRRKAIYGIRLELISGLTEDRKLAEQMVEQFNRYRLSPIHLEEVIEDFLQEQTLSGELA